MKKLLVISVFVFSLFNSSLALAAPLDDYSKAGNFAIGVWYSDNKYSLEGSQSMDGSISKSGVAANLTATIAPNIALEFNYGGNLKSTWSTPMPPISDGDSGKYKYVDYDIKVRYMALKTDKVAVIPYVGWAYDRVEVVWNDWIDPHYDVYGGKSTRSQAIIGATAVFKMNDKFRTYAEFGLGTHMSNWKLGFAYEVAKNLDIDLGYSWRRCEFKEIMGVEPKITKKGLLLGVTYKF